jgi:hypothetical protein
MPRHDFFTKAALHRRIALQQGAHDFAHDFANGGISPRLDFALHIASRLYRPELVWLSSMQGLASFQGGEDMNTAPFGKREVGSPRKIQASMNADWHCGDRNGAW